MSIERTIDGPHSLTLLLRKVANDEVVPDLLYERVGNQLQAMAQRMVHNHRQDIAPEPVALADDVFMHLIVHQRREWQSRKEFARLATCTMRRRISNHYKSIGRQKRGGGWKREFLTGEITIDSRSSDPQSLIELFDLIEHLAMDHPSAMQAIDLWVFWGWNKSEVAQLMELSENQVERLIELGRHLIRRAISSGVKP